jgi:hypothetical protein
MRLKSSGSDYLAHSFTDLMTSLMVIFVLLLLVFLNRQASTNAAVARSVAGDLRQQLEKAGFQGAKVLPNDPYTVVFQAPKDALAFARNQFRLGLEGETFLNREMPSLANILCSDQYRHSVESLIVEGYADDAQYRRISVDDSRNLNLKLGQERSREVVRKSLLSLDDQEQRACLAEKISASGRGAPDESRSVVFKVRLNTVAALAALNRITNTATISEPRDRGPAVSKVLGLFERLRAVPRQQVDFRLSEGDLNEYLSYALAINHRPGLKSATIKVFPHNYLSLYAIMDFDAVERERPDTIPLVLRPILRGTQPLSLDFRFHIQDGKATYSVEKAYYRQTELPLFAVRQLIRVVGALQPEGFRTDEPMVLPFGLRHLETGDHVLVGHN